MARLVYGMKCYGRGWAWLLQHKGYMFLLFAPMALGLGALVYGVSWIWENLDQVVAWMLFPKPEAWWAITGYYVAVAVIYLAAVSLGLLSSVLLMNVIAAPVYEWVSCAVEKDMNGGKLDEVSLWESLLLMGEELKKVLFILAISTVVAFIPVVNIFSFFVTSFLVAWDFCDYPLARRGLTFKERLSRVGSDPLAVMGFGFWLMIPFVQPFLLPPAVVGGTILSLEGLKSKPEGKDLTP